MSKIYDNFDLAPDTVYTLHVVVHLTQHLGHTVILVELGVDDRSHVPNCDSATVVSLAPRGKLAPRWMNINAEDWVVILRHPTWFQQSHYHTFVFTLKLVNTSEIKSLLYFFNDQCILYNAKFSVLINTAILDYCRETMVENSWH